MRGASDRSMMVRASAGRPGKMATTLWTMPRTVLRVWLRNSRSRAALASLPSHLYGDVGVTRAQAEAESLKRFWQI